MCQYACAADGLATTWHQVHLGSRATGGAGLVVAEATAVAAEARISPADLGLWSDAHAAALAPVAAFIDAQGAVPGIQLAHAGRKGSTQVPWLGRDNVAPGEGGWIVQAPSALPFHPRLAVPRAMDLQDIKAAIQGFGRAAGLAAQAGFRYVELHLAHGYLVHQFLSPLSNRREDDWGGPLPHRVRLARAVARAARASLPDDVVLAARLSVSDWLQGGWTVEDSCTLASLLRSDGVDMVVASSGAILPNSQPPGGVEVQPPLAARVRGEAGIATGAVGGICDAAQAEALVAQGHCDLVFLGRAMLHDPYWPLHAARNLGADERWPRPYARAVLPRAR